MIYEGRFVFFVSNKPHPSLRAVDKRHDEKEGRRTSERRRGTCAPVPHWNYGHDKRWVGCGSAHSLLWMIQIQSGVDGLQLG